MKGMISRFRQFIASNQLLTEKARTLLAVSGGVDSVVMAHLFLRAEYPFAIAHCNFQLRGEQSENDEAFVRSLADELGVPFFSTRFDTGAYCQETGLSIQMAARELRYNWFLDLLRQEAYDFIATAHHKDDVAETVLLNLIKGAVLTGLQGIPAQSGNIIRPLLWTEKDELKAYAADNQIVYREDSSNQENKYQRNLLRNQVIPLLRKINPNISNTVYEASLIRKELAQWTDVKIKEEWQNLATANENGLTIDIQSLESRAVTPAVFFMAIEEYGFSFSQIQNLFRSLSIPDAKTFVSASHRMLKERSRIIIMPYRENAFKQEGAVVMPDMENLAFDGYSFHIEVIPMEEWVMERREELAQLDFDKLDFPLQLRPWQPGDAFVPLGMRGKKKVSDFLTDLHAETLQKEQQLVLLSGENIVWLVGRRIDDRYKVGPGTKRVYRMQMG